MGGQSLPELPCTLDTEPVVGSRETRAATSVVPVAMHGPLFSRAPACGSGCPVVDSGARLGSISMSLRVARCRGFLKAHVFSGSARTTYGRDLRKRKLS